jgi:hypothetical protein
MAACVRPAAAPATDASPPAAEAPIATTAQLVERMKSHYDGRWYRTLTFLQHNTLYRADGGEEKSKWQEYQRVPGHLRIEFLPATPRSGMLFRNDTIHTFNAGRRERTSAQIHPLLLLSADVYALPVERTLAALDSLRIDRGQLRRDSWQGRPVYVVGAPAGDSAAGQFWVDAERFLLVRLITRQQAAGRAVSTDYHFTYQDVAGRPVPKEIVFLREGKPFWREEYTGVTVDADLPDELFDPARWAEARG